MNVYSVCFCIKSKLFFNHVKIFKKSTYKMQLKITIEKPSKEKESSILKGYRYDKSILI